MKRDIFLKAIASAAIFLATPITLLAKEIRRQRESKGFFVPAGKGRRDQKLSLFEGDTFYSKIDGVDTNGDMWVFESTRVKKGGPSHHVHYEQDEWWYVLEGEFTIKVGDTLFQAKPGDSVFGPRGVPHSFAKTNDGDSRLLMIFQPAGKMEAFFKSVSEGKLKGMSDAAIDEFRKAHGFERVGPPIGDLKL